MLWYCDCRPKYQWSDMICMAPQGRPHTLLHQQEDCIDKQPWDRCSHYWFV
jgi:hypothetical protein